MLFAAVQLAVENNHRVTASRMKRVEDLHLKTQTPGIMTLAQPAGARAILPQRSVWLSFRTAGACCSCAPQTSSSGCRWRAGS